jgi:hypothetical protein
VVHAHVRGSLYRSVKQQISYSKHDTSWGRYEAEECKLTSLAALEGQADMQISLWIFPEGTRHLSPEPDLLPFKKGAFYLAVQCMSLPSQQTPADE